MFDNLPYFVTINKKRYKINVDFRRIISIEEVLKGRKSKEYKILYVLQNFCSSFNSIEPNTNLYNELIKKFMWFYSCGKEDYHQKVGGSKKVDEIYSYKYDEDLIYGAFYSQYGIDLYEEKLHWWKFKALLNSLEDSTEFVKVKSYRAYEGKDKQMLELKQYWKLPRDENEKSRQEAIYNALK